MKNVIALIAALAVLANTSVAFAGIPKGYANTSNVSLSQQQAGGYVGGIWGSLLSANPNQDGQAELNTLWQGLFGSLSGVPSCSGRKCGQLCEDQLFLELLLVVIIIELQQCPTHSCQC